MPVGIDTVTSGMNDLHKCTLCTYCVTITDDECESDVAADSYLKTILDNNRSYFAADNLNPDRRIGNVVKLKLEYIIKLSFNADSLFRLTIPKDLTQY